MLRSLVSNFLSTHFFKTVSVFLSVLFIASCGGGDSNNTDQANNDGGATGGNNVLSVSQAQVNLVATMGGVTDNQIVNISSSNGGFIAIEPSASFDQNPGLVITGETSATVEIASYMLDTFGSGTYTGSVDILLCSNSLCSSDILDRVTIDVSLSLTGATLTPATLSFQQALGSVAPASQSVTYEDDAGMSYNWAADDTTYGNGASDWLQLSATSGTSMPVAIDLSVIPDGLTEGDYTAQVVIRSNAGNNLLNVTYSVGLPTLGFVESSLDVTVNGDSVTGDLLQSINLANTGDPVNWELSSDVAWLTFPVSQGTITTASSVDVQIVQAELAALGNGTHSAIITAIYQGRPDVRLELPVNLTLNSPVVEQVSPHTAYTGVAGELIIRGQGFSGLTSPVVNFGVMGATSVSVINDTEMQVNYPALAAGTHSVTVGDALGLSITSDSLVVVDPANYNYATIATTNTWTKPIYDPVRKAVYSVNYGTDVLSAIRYDEVTTNWVESTVSLTAAESVSLSNDGQFLIVPTTETFVDVRRVDPDSLTTLSSVSVNLGFNAIVDLAVPVNTGEMVLSASTFILFDPNEDSYVSGTSRFTTAAGSGGLSASLNGDRVFGGANQIAYYDFTDETMVTSTVTGSTFSENVTISSDFKGDRIAVHYDDTTAAAIYDVGVSDLALLGTLGTSFESVVISHDGNFAYVFDYDAAANPGDEYQIKVFDLNSPNGSGGFNNVSYILPDAFGGVASVKMNISGDSNTLFLTSSSHLIVWPIP